MDRLYHNSLTNKNGFIVVKIHCLGHYFVVNYKRLSNVMKKTLMLAVVWILCDNLYTWLWAMSRFVIDFLIGRKAHSR